jgi:hypothetical protein
LQLDFTITADVSRWIAARTVSFNGAFAHTSPVYVIVDGDNFRSKSKVQQLVEQRLNVLEFILEFILGRLRDPAYTATCTDGEVEALAAEVEQAKVAYKALASPVSQ